MRCTVSESLRRFARVCGAGAGLLAVCNPADAANKNWAGGATGSWSVSGNWSPVNQPIAADNVFLTQSDATNRTVTFDSAANTGTFGSITINAIGTGSILLSQGVHLLRTTDLVLGSTAAGRGSFQITGGGTFDAGSAVIGDFGDGSLSIGGAAAVDLGSTAVFGLQTGADGLLIMSGGSLTVGTMDFGGALDGVSSDGKGTAVVSGGSISVANVLRIGAGDNSSSDGTFTISNGTLSAGTLVVGAGTSSSGTMIINGGVVSLTGATLLATGASSFGRIFHSAGTFSPTARPMTIGIGQNSDATLSISGTAFHRVSTLVLGAGVGSAGTLDVSGGTFVASGASVGTVGTGTISQTGGFVDINGTLTVGPAPGASGHYAMGGGTLNGSQAFVGNSGPGTFAMSSGVASLSSVTHAIGVNAGGAGTLTLDGGSIGFDGELNVGSNGGVGYVRVNGGTLVVGTNPSFDALYVGRDGVGTVEQASGRIIVDGSLRLGEQLGAGYFGITGGQTQVADDVSLGLNNAGTLEVVGGTLSIASTLAIGNSTADGIDGFFRQTGGVVTVGSTTSIGAGSLNVGTALISGGSFSGTSVSVGFADGVGSLIISGGAVVDLSSSLTLGGSLDTGTGFASVTTAALEVSSITVRAGSTFTFNSGQLRITGTNTLNVGAPDSLLGRSVLLTASRQLSVAGAIAIAGNGFVQLDGGLLSMGTLTVAPGGLFSHNSGTVNFSSMNLQIGTGTLAPLGTAVSLPVNRALTNAAARTVTILPDGLLDVTGGYFDGGGSLVITSGGQARLSPTGGYLTATRLLNSGRLEVSGGRAQFDGVLSAPGEIVLAGSAVIAATGSFTNGGLVRGDGLVQAATVTNAATGRLRSSTGETLRILSTAAPVNNGTIELLGGAVDFGASSLNNAARMTGRGQVMAGTIANTGTMTFSAGTSDVIAALDNLNAGKTIVTGGGNATFHGPVTNTGTSEFRVSTGSTAAFLAPVVGLSLFTGGGLKIFEAGASGGPLVTAGSSVVESSGAVSADTIREQSLSILGGQVALLPGGENSRLNEFTISGSPGAWDGRFDLGDDRLIFDYTGVSPLATITSQVKQGFDGGAWDGAGISSAAAAAQSNRAIGFAEASHLGSPTTAFGEPIDASTILVRFTIPGDANLDAAVNISDFALLAAKFNSPSYWAGGDFNYDAVTNIGDFALLAANFNQSLPADVPALSGAEVPRAAAVPEPAVLAGLAAGALAVLPRRRR